MHYPVQIKHTGMLLNWKEYLFLFQINNFTLTFGN